MNLPVGPCHTGPGCLSPEWQSCVNTCLPHHTDIGTLCFFSEMESQCGAQAEWGSSKILLPQPPGCPPHTSLLITPSHAGICSQQAVSREEETSKVLSLWLEGADEENQPFLRTGGGHCIQLPSHENTLTLGPLFHI